MKERKKKTESDLVLRHLVMKLKTECELAYRRVQIKWKKLTRTHEFTLNRSYMLQIKLVFMVRRKFVNSYFSPRFFCSLNKKLFSAKNLLNWNGKKGKRRDFDHHLIYFRVKIVIQFPHQRLISCKCRFLGVFRISNSCFHEINFKGRQLDKTVKIHCLFGNKKKKF